MKRIGLFVSLLILLLVPASFLSCTEEECSHQYISNTEKEPDCINKGVRKYACALCSHSYTVELEPTGEHNYKGMVTKPSTCSQKGVKEYTCTVCDDSYTKTFPQTDHEYSYARCKFCGRADKTVDACTRMKCYLAENGAFNSSSGEYGIKFDPVYTNESKIETEAYYDIDDACVRYCMTVNEKTSLSICFVSSGGSYEWEFYDSYLNFRMRGKVTASKYAPLSTLSYTYTNRRDEDVNNMGLAISTTLLTDMLIKVEADFGEMKVTAPELGFVYF